MKVKTSVTLDARILKEIDSLRHGSRSEFIQRAVQAALQAERKNRRDREELAAMNLHAGELNGEAADVLEYQNS